MPPGARKIPRRRKRPGGARRRPGAPVPADPKLTAEGWISRFVAQGARCEELARLYREMGFEVLLVPLAVSQFSDQCGDCRLAAVLQFKLIYTRRAARVREGGSASR